MKYSLIFLLFILVCMGQTCSNKSFEGSVTYTMEFEGDFVALMETYMPESYLFSYKDGNTLIQINGGLLETLMGRILVNGSSGESFLLKAEEKRAYRFSGTSNPEEIDENQSGPRIIETDETETILGFKCNLYKMIFNEGGNELIQYVWATKEIDIKINGIENTGLPGTFSFLGLDAYPLKIKAKIQEGGFDFMIILTATSIHPDKMNSGDFRIPDDYEILDFNNAFSIPGKL
ncbi:DUF4412 domain-containing protein [Bacteroidota bacterium]